MRTTSKVDPDARIIHVGSKLFGLGATPVVITKDTLVIAGDKEGAFGDLHEWLLVQVAWEKRQGARLARAVEVGGRIGERARLSGSLSILERASESAPALPASPITDTPAQSLAERCPAECRRSPQRMSHRLKSRFP